MSASGPSGPLVEELEPLFVIHNISIATDDDICYDIKPVRKEEGKSYWKIPLCDDDATREK